ncbi:hypothetical protein RCL1_001135 [Eukaryota sp. TZLM3-RCL]
MFSDDVPLKKRAAPYLAGLMFALSIWTFVDGIMYNNRLDGQPSISFFYWTPTIVNFIFFFLTLFIDFSKVKNDVSDPDAKIARVGLFIVFILAASSFFLACWVLFEVFLSKEAVEKGIDVWPGTALLISQIFMYLSALLLVISRPDDNSF